MSKHILIYPLAYLTYKNMNQQAYTHVAYLTLYEYESASIYPFSTFSTA